MQTYISILRGINVSGVKMIKMAELKKLFDEMGFVNSQTYIQSGNVVFQSSSMDVQELTSQIKTGIQQKFGFDVPVLVKTLEDIMTVVNNNPFTRDPQKEASFLHITFLSDIPSYADIEIIQGDFGTDEYTIIGENIYLYCPSGYGNTKLNNNYFEKKLKVMATTRNWKTTQELLAIASKVKASQL